MQSFMLNKSFIRKIRKKYIYTIIKKHFTTPQKKKNCVLFVVTATIKIIPVSARQTKKDEIALLWPLIKLANKFVNTLGHCDHNVKVTFHEKTKTRRQHTFCCHSEHKEKTCISRNEHKNMQFYFCEH